MSDTIRVKDLADELNVTTKDLVQTLRKLEMSAKSHMSSLTQEEADQVRSKLQGAGRKTEVVSKEIQPGVIRRRRRRAKDEPKAPVDAQAAGPESVAPQETAKPDSSIETVAPDQADATSGDTEVETGVDEPAVHKTPAARIIKPAHEETVQETTIQTVEEQAPAPAEAEADDAEADDAEAAAAAPEATPDEADAAPKEPAADKPVAEEPVSATDAKTGQEADAAAQKDEQSESAETEAKKKKKRKKKKEPEAAGPQVKVIYVPDAAEQAKVKAQAETAKAAAETAKAAAETAKAAAETPPRRRSGPAPSTAGPGQQPSGPPPAAADGRKKRKKDKRVVDFSQSLSDEEDRRRASLQAKKKKQGPINDKTGGRARPASKRRRGFEEPVHEQALQQTTQPLKAAKRKLRIDEAIRLSDMAHQMGVKAQELIKALLGMGVMATINQSVDLDTATLLAAEFGYEVEKVGFDEEEYIMPQEADAPESLRPRPPVVTIMGHVDHGKTSLLDAIRQSHVASGEAGGITQHIGAYHVPTPRGEVVFLDTPGHEAFTAMRARGAQVTDIVILVVAADDGVMDQTREAVNHSRAAGVPIVVAVNKIDKEGADPDRVKRELAELGLSPEDWGGDTIFAHVSAKQLQGLDELLELVLLQAEVLELSANPDKPARGHIVEARLDKGRGAVATVLIQEGMLHQGDSFVCGLYNGRVRAMFNDQGKKVKEAGPAIPVEVQGFEGVPEAGDEFVAVADEKVARRIADSRQIKQRERDLAKESKVTLETFLAKKSAEEAQTLNLIVKSDVQGSQEAITESLAKLSTDEIKVRVIHGGAGAITESDILLASASDAIIIGFNVRPTVKVKEVAERESVDIRYYDIIYKLVDDIKSAMTGMLAPIIREVYLGQAEIRETFSVPKVGVVAGCFVVDGKIPRNANIRLLRDGVVVHTGTIDSLKRFKEDVKEVAKGYECGMNINKFNDVKVGDVIEAFEHVEEAATL